jgi:hypothetical protein
MATGAEEANLEALAGSVVTVVTVVSAVLAVLAVSGQVMNTNDDQTTNFYDYYLMRSTVPAAITMPYMDRRQMINNTSATSVYQRLATNSETGANISMLLPVHCGGDPALSFRVQFGPMSAPICTFPAFFSDILERRSGHLGLPELYPF